MYKSRVMLRYNKSDALNASSNAHQKEDTIAILSLSKLATFILLKYTCKNCICGFNFSLTVKFH
jgi:hypothetical protein